AARGKERLDELSVTDPALTGHQADGGDHAQMAAVAQAIGTIDWLVVTLASSEGPGPVADLDLTMLRRAFEAKFWPFLTTIQAVLPRMARSPCSAPSRPRPACRVRPVSPPLTARSRPSSGRWPWNWHRSGSPGCPPAWWTHRGGVDCPRTSGGRTSARPRRPCPPGGSPPPRTWPPRSCWPPPTPT